MRSSRHTETIGVVLLAFGAVVLAIGSDEIPDRSRLIEVRGPIRSLEVVRSRGGGPGAVRFTLTNDPRHFHYRSQAGRADDVRSALERAGSAEVSAWIDPAITDAPPAEGRTFHPVFELRVGEQLIRPYAEVAASLRTNRFFGASLGYGTVIAGAVFLCAYFLRRPGGGRPLAGGSAGSGETRETRG